jgi:putative OPT family oligopeptide transporter
MRKTIFTGLSKALIKKENSDEVLLRTEIDLPLDKVLIVCGILVGFTFLYYWWATGSLVLALAGALFLGVVSFFFAAVAGYIAGVVGSSNSPVSGMTIATLLFTVALVWVVGDLFLGLGTEELMLATLLIAAIVATSAAIAGDVMQDLKTGHMVGATPWRQQTAEIIGVVTGAVVIGPTLQLLHKAFRISKTACEMNPLPDDPTCSNALFAPQAELIGAIVQGAFGGDLNISMVMLGAIIAVALIMLKMPVMSVAIGIYLPLGLSVPIMLGGVISYFALNAAYLRIDGHLDGKPSKKAEKAGKDVENRGVLIGAGFIAGESILGVLIAVLIVMDIKLDAVFGVTTLNDVFSLLFFGWFVTVFIWLATRALPKGGNLFSEASFILNNVTWKFFNAFKLKNLK